MSKKISFNNKKAVAAALDAANFRARTRTMSADYLARCVSCLERKLEKLGIKKTDWRGVRAVVGLEDFAKAYKFPPVGTVCTIERGASVWFVSIAREYCKGSDFVRFTDEQKRIISARAVADAMNFE